MDATRRTTRRTPTRTTAASWRGTAVAAALLALTTACGRAGDAYHARPGTEGLVGAGGSRVFTFEAVAAGRTRVVLLHCPVYVCSGGPASPAPATTAPAARPAAERVTYTVTVDAD
ncbi:protease inhibitor I42 family protein [Streptomyces sp. NPDC052682]|uniref:protease inhibitor I42 family protein n=1 Tax=Streptomyces sp. NPDC052682 TaxID=3154954 RepID=UPI003416E126